jgi:hypothetical protein
VVYGESTFVNLQAPAFSLWFQLSLCRSVSSQVFSSAIKLVRPSTGDSVDKEKQAGHHVFWQRGVHFLLHPILVAFVYLADNPANLIPGVSDHEMSFLPITNRDSVDKEKQAGHHVFWQRGVHFLLHRLNQAIYADTFTGRLHRRRYAWRD